MRVSWLSLSLFRSLSLSLCVRLSVFFSTYLSLSLSLFLSLCVSVCVWISFVFFTIIDLDFIDLIKEIQKKIPRGFSKARRYLNNITCLYIQFWRQACLFLYQEKITCFTGMAIFSKEFFFSIEMCFYIKNELVEINVVNISCTKIFI